MSDEWKPYAIDYDPIKVGSIDATDTQPHDRAIIKAIKVYKFFIQFIFLFESEFYFSLNISRTQTYRVIPNVLYLWRDLISILMKTPFKRFGIFFSYLLIFFFHLI
jgi:hypothetical protein